MGNVLFFPTSYLPDLEEAKRLERWQEQLSLWRAELAYLHKQKNFSPGEIALSKARFHNGVRDNWRVFKGFKVELAKRSLP